MPRHKPHIFAKSIYGVITIITLSSYIFFRGIKEKKDFNKISGKVVYCDNSFEDLPNRDFGKYRYLKINNFQSMFQIFIGKDFGDFKPALELIDSIRIGDEIEIYFDTTEMESDPRINNLIQYIDKDSIPYYIRGNHDKIFGTILFSIGVIIFLTLLILKRQKKIE